MQLGKTGYPPNQRDLALVAALRLLHQVPLEEGALSAAALCLFPWSLPLNGKGRLKTATAVYKKWHVVKFVLLFEFYGEGY